MSDLDLQQVLGSRYKTSQEADGYTDQLRQHLAQLRSDIGPRIPHHVHIGQRQPARGQQLDGLGQMLVGAAAGQQFITHQQQTEAWQRDMRGRGRQHDAGRIKRGLGIHETSLLAVSVGPGTAAGGRAADSPAPVADARPTSRACTSSVVCTPVEPR